MHIVYHSYAPTFLCLGALFYSHINIALSMERYLTQADLDDMYRHNPDLHEEDMKKYRITTINHKPRIRRQHIIKKLELIRSQKPTNLSNNDINLIS